MPWYYIFLNIYLFIQSIISFISSSSLKPLLTARKQLGLTIQIPVFKRYRPDIEYIIPALPELDYPYSIPSNMTCCGPIVRAFPPLAEIDCQLAKWLSNGPTVLINLGSHFESEAEDAVKIVKGMRVVLARHATIQFLWKLGTTNNALDEKVSQIIGTEIDSGRVKVERWLKAEPLAILQTGDIVAFVHHGGANSFYEAVKYVDASYADIGRCFTPLSLH